MGKHAPPQSNHEARRQHWLDSNHLHFLQCEMLDLLLHMNRILRSMWPRLQLHPRQETISHVR